MIWNEGNHDLIGALRTILDRRMAPDEARMLGDFAERFLRNLAAQDLAGRAPSDLAGAVTGFWAFLRHFDGARAKVRVFNPDPHRHGWHLDHTAVVVLCRDMPFALESVRAELNRRNLTIHIVHSLPFRARRDADRQLLELLPQHGDAADGQAEALLYLEIGRSTDSAELKALRLAVEDVLAEVKAATDDFAAMLVRLDRAAEDIAVSCAGASADDLGEVQQFLHWMRQGHFTFLGYEYLRCQRDGAAVRIERDSGMDLGLLRLRSGSGRSEFYGDTGGGELPPLAFSKSAVRSRVHRRVYPDYVEVRILQGGEPVAVHRFMGLYTSRTYAVPVSEIPVVRRKAAEVMRRSRLDPRSHEGSALARVLEVFPRDELFQADTDELFNMAMGINQIQERRQIRLFTRHDRRGKFISCLLFMPRDIYQTQLRQRIQNLLLENWRALEAEFATFFSESILTRTQFILRLDPEHEPSRPPDTDTRQLEARIVELAMTWEDHLRNHLVTEFGEERGAVLADAYRDAFPAGYRDDCDPATAWLDIRKMATLAGSRRLALRLYRHPSDPGNALRFRLYHQGAALVLSDVLPILEHLGPVVIGERVYGIHRRDGKSVWIHEFALRYPGASQVEVEALAELFQEAFARIWSGAAESDRFNQLVPGALLGWREVMMLRAYARYLRQIRFPFSSDYLAGACGKHPRIARMLVDLFATRFDPDLDLEWEARVQRQAGQVDAIETALEGVENLAEDRALRALLNLMLATVRCNYYGREGDEPVAVLCFKLDCGHIADLPAPRPEYELFVYSPRLEGVHLRGGKVARGGLRWSDRLEDYRTEILGLFKAQQVKNAVIVPSGAKGGFVVRTLADDADRDHRDAEARACYRLFIGALLSVTDNLWDGGVVPPERVVRWDDDDPYLVVAADKGTARFSDLANEVAADYRYWLGDAFASGGRNGYDHKRMGITARGAWISVQRHFREMGVDVQSSPVSVVGIGDMSGDVFGNGMLRSRQIRLLAAFNHRHIFLDPDPDPATSFEERRRLYAREASWDEYDTERISAGGGVYSRDAKSIALTPEVRRALAIDAERLASSELISALLRAPADLLWNGGIGTYIKARSESNAEVGDKANDTLRIDAADLRCTVIGEGGNLGMTQRARIEYALAGGRCNTDFIDNSAGVDCSDHEVNLKIALDQLVLQKQLDAPQREQLLEALTDEVAELVLENNRAQTLALSLAERDAAARIGEYRRLMVRLENEAGLDRRLEDLPDDEQLEERRVRGEGLTRPELAMLMCLGKSQLKKELACHPVVDDPYLDCLLYAAFPRVMGQRYGETLKNHRLRREIVATGLANTLVNDMGITFVERLRQSTNTDAGSIARAYMAARDLFDLPAQWTAISALQDRVEGAELHAMLAALIRLVRRGTRWLLRNRGAALDIDSEVSLFHDPLLELSQCLPQLLTPLPLDIYHRRQQRLQAAGVPEPWAGRIGLAPFLYHGLAIIDIANQQGEPPQRVAEVLFRIAAELELHWFAGRLAEMKVDSYWQGMARESYRDDFEDQLRMMVEAVLQCSQGTSIEEGLQCWLQLQQPLVERWRRMLMELHAIDAPDISMYTVAVRELLTLASGRGGRARSDSLHSEPD